MTAGTFIYPKSEGAAAFQSDIGVSNDYAINIIDGKSSLSLLLQMKSHVLSCSNINAEHIASTYATVYLICHWQLYG